MPAIYELIGFPTSDRSPIAEASRKAYSCPFMHRRCDGGGNRFQSGIDLSRPEHESLSLYFDSTDVVQPGVCSIQVKDGENPWIVCPHRLFYLGDGMVQTDVVCGIQAKLVEICGFAPGTVLGIWREVRLKYREGSGEHGEAVFDYIFDYILMPLRRTRIGVAAAQTGLSESETLQFAKAGGFPVTLISGEKHIGNFPSGDPVIIEAMTSSTTGGKRSDRSGISQAFEDCILKVDHSAPRVNYRQVWARMASQLIVKSQAAVGWGGKAIWILQDLLARYISESTALNLGQFESEVLDEVNILACSYGTERNPVVSEGCTLDVSDFKLYSGPIRPRGEKDEPSFRDIILAPVCPPRTSLVSALLRKGSCVGVYVT